jgi:hypothetical protein
MSTVVILDADFLSAFLKIERLPLLLTFYQVERLYVPSAVYRELAVTSLLPSLLAIPWIGIEDPMALLRPHPAWRLLSVDAATGTLTAYAAHAQPAHGMDESLHYLTRGDK